MKISVMVKPNARHEDVTPQEDGTILVRVNAPPVEGRANERVIRLLAKHFGVAASRVRIVAGLHGKRKLVEIG